VAQNCRMAAVPPAQLEQLSPDQRTRGSNACIWWLAGGCALLVAVVIVGAVLAWSAFSYRLQHGGFNCLPSDFPTYPGSTFGGEQYNLNAPTPGNACNMVFESKDSVATVRDFYANRLNAGDWQVTSNSETTGQITFRNVKNVKTVSTNGSVNVAVRGNGAEITVQYYSRNL
jgi:hypothetical protein